MAPRIRLRRLILRGLTRDYGPDLLREGDPRGLMVIAGQIMTGKTSVLEFIDFCLGGADHPTHQEIRDASIRTALLELEVGDERCVIERAVFPSEPRALIHWASIEDLGTEHAKEDHPIRPAGSPESLSSLLLGWIGLAGLSLKEAPTQIASGADPLSFRDLMPVIHLTNERLGSTNLLFENEYMRALKLRQVIDAVFGVHEGRLVELSAAIEERRRAQSEAERSVATIRKFLTDRQLNDEAEVELRIATIAPERAEVEDAISAIDRTMTSQSAELVALRKRHQEALAARAKAAAVLRDRDTLIDRLTALRGQYAADVKRLAFATQAQLLFGALEVTHCPSCLQRLEAPAGVDEGGHCTLCRQAIPAAEEVPPAEIAGELRATQSRLDELNRYMDTVANERGTARDELAGREDEERRTRDAVDRSVAPTVAPFLSQRNELVARREDLNASEREYRRVRDLYDGVRLREADKDRISREVDSLTAQLAALSSDRPSRNQLVADLSARFASILGDFGFPKLTDAFLDDNYVPHVRGERYTKLSSGGRTLSALAWQLAILELAVEREAAHPGLAMIDGIQKNLTPVGERPDPEYGRPEIITQIYRHLDEWLTGAGRDAQVLVVDNRPPTIAEESIVKYYSGLADQPPYGLIEDAVG
jgi:hypothetical protein